MSHNINLDDLGNTIENIIDRAVSSRDFQQMNQTICQVLNTAVDTGADAVRRAADEAAKRKAARSKIVEARSDRTEYAPPYQTQARNRVRLVPLGPGKGRTAGCLRCIRIPPASSPAASAKPWGAAC